MRGAIKLVPARSGPDYSLAGELFLEYSGDIGLDLSFQDFDRELAALSVQYGPPYGGIILLRAGDRWAGCVGVRRCEGDTAELKRMYVRREFRGRGFGRLLGENALALAHRLGYRAIRLDTLPDMSEAIALYRSLGFYEIGPYRFNPLPGAKYFELKLEGRSGAVNPRIDRRMKRGESTRGYGSRKRRDG